MAISLHVDKAPRLPASIHRQPASKTPRLRRIAIIGAGFSGTLVLGNLIAKAPAGSLDIELFEPGAEPATGVAYGTKEPVHLLNVQAGKMGAIPAVPEDFFHWLKSESGLKASAQVWPGRTIEASDYVPRILYGRYLRELLARILRKARQQGNRVRITRAEVADIALRRNGAILEIAAAERRVQFDAVVLATGSLPPRRHGALSRSTRRSQRYVDDLWQADPALFRRAAQLSPEKSILIFGSGLTAVDAILAFRANGFEGKIVAISRRGQLPLPQLAGARRPWTFSVAPENVKPAASAFVAWLKREARLAEAAGIGWRSVFDTIRPLSQDLWQALDVKSRQRILRAISLWNIHRHRMAPEVHARIEAQRNSGTLDVLGARVHFVERRLGGFTVRFVRRGAKTLETIRPVMILNCTGPDSDVAAADDPLLKNLLRRRLILPSALGGVAAREKAVAEGENGGRLFVIGPLLAGGLFESTAVPELRDLAAHAAELVLARLRVQYDAAVPLRTA